MTGSEGLLAPYLIEEARKLGVVFSSARASGDFPCDLSDRASIRRLMESTRPDWIVHAAALTDVDRCERFPEEADCANRLVVANLVDAIDENVRLVMLSTDQVYPNLPGPHREQFPGPVNVYGYSKLAGENEAMQHPRSLVVRTNFFGPSRSAGRSSLDEFFIRSFSAKHPTKLFTDVQFSPIHMASLAALIFDALGAGLAGIYNLGTRNGMTKAEFGIAVARHFGLDTDCALLCQSSQIPERAPRPLDLRLDTSKFEAALGCILPTLQSEIERL